MFLHVLPSLAVERQRETWLSPMIVGRVLFCEQQQPAMRISLETEAYLGLQDPDLICSLSFHLIKLGFEFGEIATKLLNSPGS
jgi:hypothetical protein